MMWPLAVEAWRLSGRRLPECSRAETPVRILADASGEREPRPLNQDFLDFLEALLDEGCGSS